MSATLSLTESQTIAALRSFLLAILPAGLEVIAGQDNRVPEPIAADFVTMTPIGRERLETNRSTYTDGFPTAGPTTRADLQATKITVQLDIHGPSAADNAQIITTVFRSGAGVDLFSTAGIDVAPLYTSEPHQMPFTNEAQQVEQRWTFDVTMQANPVVTLSQDFAAALVVGIHSVDADYPPT